MIARILITQKRQVLAQRQKSISFQPFLPNQNLMGLRKSLNFHFVKNGVSGDHSGYKDNNRGFCSRKPEENPRKQRIQNAYNRLLQQLKPKKNGKERPATNEPKSSSENTSSGWRIFAMVALIFEFLLELFLAIIEVIAAILAAIFQ
jgi:hypothetical protein